VGFFANGIIHSDTSH